MSGDDRIDPGLHLRPARPRPGAPSAEVDADRPGAAPPALDAGAVRELYEVLDAAIDTLLDLQGRLLEVLRATGPPAPGRPPAARGGESPSAPADDAG